MSITFRQAAQVLPARAPTPADALAGRRDDGAAPVRGAELPQAGRPGQAVDVRADPAAQGQDVPPDPATLTRAVEDANALAETVLRSGSRSVQFGRDEQSGLVVIKIREQRDGEVVERQIPEPDFVRLVHRLRQAAEGGSASGALIDLDG
jgi:uncharacterized FlaG/YvyC family protein